MWLLVHSASRDVIGQPFLPIAISFHFPLRDSPSEGPHLILPFLLLLLLGTLAPPSLTAAETLLIGISSTYSNSELCCLPFRALLPSTPSAHVDKEPCLYLSDLQHGNSQFVLQCPLSDNIHYQVLFAHMWKSKDNFKKLVLPHCGFQGWNSGHQTEPSLQPLLRFSLLWF